MQSNPMRQGDGMNSRPKAGPDYRRRRAAASTSCRRPSAARAPARKPTASARPTSELQAAACDAEADEARPPAECGHSGRCSLGVLWASPVCGGARLSQPVGHAKEDETRPPRQQVGNVGEGVAAQTEMTVAQRLEDAVQSTGGVAPSPSATATPTAAARPIRLIVVIVIMDPLHLAVLRHERVGLFALSGEHGLVGFARSKRRRASE
jgi:hypothetical protein